MSPAAPDRVRLVQVLRDREFAALLTSSGFSILGDQIARIAIAIIVYGRTGSAFLSASTVAVSYLTWVVGGPVLSSLADRRPRRRLMLQCDAARAALVGLLVLPGVPLWALFAVMLCVGVLAPPFDSAKSSLMPEILEGDRYVVGNAAIGAVLQGGQALGFLLGGILVATISPRGALLADALTFVVSGCLVLLFLKDRPQPERPSTTMREDVVAGVRTCLASPVLRRLLGYAAVGSLVAIVPESLAVPVADRLGGGPVTVGFLIAAGPVGFLIGSVAVLRMPHERRDGTLWWLTALSCIPLLFSPLIHDSVTMTVVWTLAGTGAAAQLIANAAYMVAVPAGGRGRAFGVAMLVIMVSSGLGAFMGGAVAELVDVRTAVALMSLLTLALLVPVARMSRTAPPAAVSPVLFAQDTVSTGRDRS